MVSIFFAELHLVKHYRFFLNDLPISEGRKTEATPDSTADAEIRVHLRDKHRRLEAAELTISVELFYFREAVRL